MAKGVIPFPQKQCWQVISNSDLKKQFDDTYEDGRLIEKIADQTYIMYQRVKKVAIVSGRDFVLLLHFN